MDDNRSLYGDDALHRKYMKHFGRPLYRASRRLGLPEYLSLAAAHVPGAVAHIAILIPPSFAMHNWYLATGVFLLSEAFFPARFYMRHREFKRARAQRMAERDRPEKPREEIEAAVARLYS